MIERQILLPILQVKTRTIQTIKEEVNRKESSLLMAQCLPGNSTTTLEHCKEISNKLQLLYCIVSGANRYIGAGLSSVIFGKIVGFSFLCIVLLPYNDIVE